MDGEMNADIIYMDLRIEGDKQSLADAAAEINRAARENTIFIEDGFLSRQYFNASEAKVIEKDGCYALSVGMACQEYEADDVLENYTFGLPVYFEFTSIETEKHWTNDAEWKYFKPFFRNEDICYNVEVSYECTKVVCHIILEIIKLICKHSN